MKTRAIGNKRPLGIPGTRVQRGHEVDSARQRFVDALLAIDPCALSKLPGLQAWARIELGGWSGRSWHPPDGRLEINNEIATEVRGAKWYRYPEHFAWLARVTLKQANYVEIARSAGTSKETVHVACKRLQEFIGLAYLLTD